MIDVHDEALFYTVGAWRPDFAGYIVDYGAYPDQRRSYFALRDIRVTLAHAAIAESGAGAAINTDAAILAGLIRLATQLLERNWTREDAVSIPLGILVIDIGYKPEVVREAIIQLRKAFPGASVMPYRGNGIKASNKPMSEYDYKPGDRKGHFWRVYKPAKHLMQTFEADVNYWKSRVRDGWYAAPGAPGCLQVFDAPHHRHQCYGDHHAAERPKLLHYPKENRWKEEWEILPAKPDNHWLDTTAGCAAGASLLGAMLPGSQAAPKQKKEKIRLSDIQRNKNR